jgi:hypothetical protein
MNNGDSFPHHDINIGFSDPPGDSRTTSMPQDSNHPLSKEIQIPDASQNSNSQSSFPPVASSSNVKLPHVNKNFGRPPNWQSTPFPTPKSHLSQSEPQKNKSTVSETQNSSSQRESSSAPQQKKITSNWLDSSISN